MSMQTDVDALAGMTLFADLSKPQLEAAAHTFEEEMFPGGQRILRQGFKGTGFYVILEGEAAVNVDGEPRASLGKGDFFGEVSVLLEEPPTADIVATTDLRCLVLAAPEVEEFLITYPRVMFRMLQAEARRLRSTIKWQD